jgi:hypothetical protein
VQYRSVQFVSVTEEMSRAKRSVGIEEKKVEEKIEKNRV